MHVDFYASTFYAQRTDLKEKYKILASEAASYYSESMFILSVQVILCIAIWSNKEFTTINYNNDDYFINLCGFFTALVLHFGCINTIRNGMNMIKFAVFHSEEFE